MRRYLSPTLLRQNGSSTPLGRVERRQDRAQRACFVGKQDARWSLHLLRSRRALLFSCLIQVWSWVFPAQSHIQYSAVNKSLFSTHADNHPALVSRTSQRREGENVTFRGHLLIPFCFVPLSFRKTTNPPHHLEVEIHLGGLSQFNNFTTFHQGDCSTT